MLRVRYFAGARAAAGVAEEHVDAASVVEAAHGEAAHGATLGALLDALRQRHGEPLARVLAAASFLVDGEPRHDPDHPLPPGSVVDVLPPFAGG